MRVMGNSHSEGASAAPSSGSIAIAGNSATKLHHGIPIVEGAACPVKHGASSPVHKALLGGGKSSPGTCPVVSDAGNKESSRSKGPVYNVYSQEIDPKNMMPAANQEPSAGQKVPLSTQRVQSTIPKGGTEGSWLYPSPQMFWNSLVRKGKADGVSETDVDMVVAIHNEMNERTWKQLLQWESSHKSEQLDGEPALRRFQGNPWSPSPKARLKSLFGYGWPFDRHDWFVDRGGKQVHYVIDYYFNPNGPAVSPAEVAASKLTYTSMIHVDVRPAVDTVGSVWDRLLGFPARAALAAQRPRYVAEGLDPVNAPKDVKETAPKHSSDATSVLPEAPPLSTAVLSKWDDVDIKCGPLLTKLQSSLPEDARRSTSLAFNYCMGRILCPSQADAFMRILEGNAGAGVAGNAGGKEEMAFEAMTQCVLRETQSRPKMIPLSQPQHAAKVLQ